MAKTTKKKRTTKKKMVEGEYEVAVTDNTPGTKIPKKTATVDARNAETAVSAALDGAEGGAEEVTVKKKSAMGRGGNSSGGNTGGGVHSMESITEAVKYPYTISLPRAFASFLTESGIDYVEVGTTVMTTFPNKTRLRDALREFKKANMKKATIILEGVGRSLS